MEQVLKFLESQLPTGLAGGGLFGIWLYFRKEYAAILAAHKETIADQARQIKELWAENRLLRGDANGKHDDEKADE